MRNISSTTRVNKSGKRTKLSLAAYIASRSRFFFYNVTYTLLSLLGYSTPPEKLLSSSLITGTLSLSFFQCLLVHSYIHTYIQNWIHLSWLQEAALLVLYFVWVSCLFIAVLFPHGIYFLLTYNYIVSQLLYDFNMYLYLYQLWNWSFLASYYVDIIFLF